MVKLVFVERCTVQDVDSHRLCACWPGTEASISQNQGIKNNVLLFT